MKTNLIKIATVSAIFALTTATSQSQIIKPGATLGFNLVYSKPLGDFKRSYQVGIGGEVFGGVDWGKTSLIGTFSLREYGDGWCFCYSNLDYLSFKLGVKQLLLMKRLFVQGDVGLASVKYGGLTRTSFAPGIGAGVRLARLELGLFYETFKTHPQSSNLYSSPGGNANSINAKLGYSFSFPGDKNWMNLLIQILRLTNSAD